VTSSRTCRCRCSSSSCDGAAFTPPHRKYSESLPHLVHAIVDRLDDIVDQIVVQLLRLMCM
jgi:hypothetical protein